MVRASLFHKVPCLIAGAPVDGRRYNKSVENNLERVSCILIFTKYYKYFVLYIDVLINRFKGFSGLLVMNVLQKHY